MSADKLMAALDKQARGWNKIEDDSLALQDNWVALVDEISAQMTNDEWLRYGRKLNAVWRKRKNKNLAYTYAAIFHAMKILMKYL